MDLNFEIEIEILWGLLSDKSEKEVMSSLFAHPRPHSTYNHIVGIVHHSTINNIKRLLARGLVRDFYV